MVIANDMKKRGMYIARHLSVQGVIFRVEQVHLSPKFIEDYDGAVKIWTKLAKSFAAAVRRVDPNAKLRQATWDSFWSVQQGFFKYLCMAAKLEQAVKSAREALEQGKCVVIDLRSSRGTSLENDDMELFNFIPSAKRRFCFYPIFFSLIVKLSFTFQVPFKRWPTRTSGRSKRKSPSCWSSWAPWNRSLPICWTSWWSSWAEWAKWPN